MPTNKGEIQKTIEVIKELDDSITTKKGKNSTVLQNAASI